MKLRLQDILRPKRPAQAAPIPPKPATVPQPTTPSNPSKKPTRPTTAPVEEPANEFGQTLEKLLGNKYKATNVSEEELYAALICHQIKQKYGNQDANDWISLFKFSMADRPQNEFKGASAERAANDVMDKFFAKDGIIIPVDEAKKIKDTAFRLAQLDDNPDALWDKYGGGNDKTIAVTSFSRAQKLVQERLDAEANVGVSSRRLLAKSKAPRLSRLG